MLRTKDQLIQVNKKKNIVNVRLCSHLIEICETLKINQTLRINDRFINPIPLETKIPKIKAQRCHFYLHLSIIQIR
jgi:hypothetical protein